MATFHFLTNSRQVFDFVSGHDWCGNKMAVVTICQKNELYLGPIELRHASKGGMATFHFLTNFHHVFNFVSGHDWWGNKMAVVTICQENKLYFGPIEWLHARKEGMATFHFLTTFNQVLNLVTGHDWL